MHRQLRFGVIVNPLIPFPPDSESPMTLLFLRVSSLRFFGPRKCIRYMQLRSFSQTHDEIPSKEAVDLSCTAYLPEDGNVTSRLGALVILHGLLSVCIALKNMAFVTFYLFKVVQNVTGLQFVRPFIAICQRGRYTLWI